MSGVHSAPTQVLVHASMLVLVHATKLLLAHMTSVAALAKSFWYNEVLILLRSFAPTCTPDMSFFDVQNQFDVASCRSI